MSRRDTQFQGFAKALMQDLNTVSTTTYASVDKAREAYELTIARRSYDLVKHALTHFDTIYGEFDEIEDMPKLPKEQS